MKWKGKKGAVATAIFMVIVLVLLGQIAASDAFAKFGRTPKSDGQMAPMTGQIDTIGTKYIVIDDTSFKITENVSISGYKVGDRVTFVANYKNEIEKIRPADKQRATSGVTD